MSEKKAAYKANTKSKFEEYTNQFKRWGDSYCIGIDPGTKTGVAIWNKTLQEFEAVETMKIHDALALVESFCLYAEAASSTVTAYVEDPNTWKGWGSRQHGTAKAQGAGSVKRDFAIWRDFLESIRVEMIPVKLQGTMKKMKADLFKQTTGWQARTTTHSRDAACLVFKRQ